MNMVAYEERIYKKRGIDCMLRWILESFEFVSKSTLGSLCEKEHVVRHKRGIS
jgi:hypothetical protein